MHFVDEFFERVELLFPELLVVLDPLRGGRAGVTGVAGRAHAEPGREPALEFEPAAPAARSVQEHEIGPVSGHEHLDGRPADVDRLEKGVVGSRLSHR